MKHHRCVCVCVYGERSGTRTERACCLGLASQWQRQLAGQGALEGRRQVSGWWCCVDGAQPWLLRVPRVPPLERCHRILTLASQPLRVPLCGSPWAGSWALRAEGRPLGVQSSETGAALRSGRQRVTLASSVGFERTGGRPDLHVPLAAWPQGLPGAGVWADVLSQWEGVLALSLQIGGGA